MQAASSPRLISLASDTETRPTPAMREAMARAEVGDEQRNEDPTIDRLQERVAALLGKEAALWFPTGTMCNLVAVKAHTRPGDAVIAESMAHVIRAESGGAALVSGVLIEPIATSRGIFSAAQLTEALGRLRTLPSPYGPQPRLVCVEQTHNFGGGSIWSLAELGEVSATARSQGLALHMDGARLLNACIASGVAAAEFGKQVDSVWLDFTKGLGAPIGAVLAGSKQFIAEARRYKHLFGGAMRQAGIAAAGCLYALDHHVERLAEDHANARFLSQALAAMPGIAVRTPQPETNIVFFDVRGTRVANDVFVSELAKRNVRVGAVSGMIRAVTHLDVSRAEVEIAIAAISDIVR